MARHPQTMHLARWVRDQLQTVRSLETDVLQYALTTFGSADLHHILSTADSDEVDSLLDLIYYPDLDLQRRYEQRWGTIVFDHDACQSILSEVVASPLVGAICYRGAGATIATPLPHWLAELFLQRLNITWQPVETVVQRMDTCLNPEQRIETRIVLRNAGRREPPHQADLLGHVIEALSSSPRDYHTCLVFIVSILEEFKSHQSPFDFLISKKEFYFQALCKAEDFERKRQHSNMETLMLQGARAAHGSAMQWRRQMRLIDTVCRALFGRTRFLSQPRDVHIDIRRSDDGWDMDEVLRSL